MRKFLYPEEGFIEKETINNGCWIKVVDPSHEDFVFLLEELEIPESFLSDIADADERPRTEKEDGWNLTIIRIPIETYSAAIPFTTIPLGVLYSPSKNIKVTVSFKRSTLIPNFISHCKKKNHTLVRETDFIYRLIYSSAFWFLKYLKSITALILEAEESLENSVQNKQLHELMKLQKSLVYFSTSIQGNQAIVDKMQRVGISNVNSELLEDLKIELKQAESMVMTHREILKETMDAFASVISNNVNTIMKRMTSISIILMIPTLLSSLFGMNVPNMFEKTEWAFYFLTVLCIILSGVFFFRLKKKKWF